MRITIHQPPYLPWLGFFAKVAAADELVLLDTAAHSRGSFDNRNLIRTKNGPQWLTVPVERDSEKAIKDLRVCNEHGWQRKHWRAIELAYSKAPHWGLYRDELATFYHEKEWHTLGNMNASMLDWFITKMDIHVDLPFDASDTAAAVEHKGSELILRLCRERDAMVYLSGPKGRDYLDLQAFAHADVQVLFQEYAHPTYKHTLGFLPNMCILDAMFHCDPDDLLRIITDGNSWKME